MFEWTWTQVPHRASGLSKAFAGKYACSSEMLRCAGHVDWHSLVRGLELEDDSGEALGQRVVDLASETVALLQFADLSRLGIEPRILHGDSDLRRQCFQERGVAGVEVITAVAFDIQHAQD